MILWTDLLFLFEFAYIVFLGEPARVCRLRWNVEVTFCSSFSLIQSKLKPWALDVSDSRLRLHFVLLADKKTSSQVKSWTSCGFSFVCLAPDLPYRCWWLVFLRPSGGGGLLIGLVPDDTTSQVRSGPRPASWPWHHILCGETKPSDSSVPPERLIFLSFCFETNVGSTQWLTLLLSPHPVNNHLHFVLHCCLIFIVYGRFCKWMFILLFNDIWKSIYSFVTFVLL